MRFDELEQQWCIHSERMYSKNHLPFVIAWNSVQNVASIKLNPLQSVLSKCTEVDRQKSCTKRNKLVTFAFCRKSSIVCNVYFKIDKENLHNAQWWAWREVWLDRFNATPFFLSTMAGNLHENIVIGTWLIKDCFVWHLSIPVSLWHDRNNCIFKQPHSHRTLA